MKVVGDPQGQKQQKYTLCNFLVQCAQTVLKLCNFPYIFF